MKPPNDPCVRLPQCHSATVPLATTAVKRGIPPGSVTNKPGVWCQALALSTDARSHAVTATGTCSKTL